MKLTKQPPTIKEIETELLKEFSSGFADDFAEDLVKDAMPVIRQKITEMLEWLEMEEKTIPSLNQRASDPKKVISLRNQGYNQAVDELNQKIKQLKEQ